jgi:hypothetical protein
MNHGRIIALQIIILLIGLGLDWFINFLRKSVFRYSKYNAMEFEFRETLLYVENLSVAYDDGNNY